ncbi:MAG: LysM peptidoglycan-binding domain-containing protein [Caldilineaceae bacterium SB0664_bin_22]|nr:LysM peptidoglycan-binding domain-containing protein [Caldilineaceae bacterium SB0664_bin_22]
MSTHGLHPMVRFQQAGTERPAQPMRGFPIGVRKKKYNMTGGLRCQGWGRVMPLCLVVCCLLLSLLQTDVVAQGPPQLEARTLEVPHSPVDWNGTTPAGQQTLNKVDEDDSANGDQGEDTQAVESEVTNFDCARQYVVVQGDTLLAIAIRYDVTVAAIRKASNLTETDPLSVGRTLCIPGEAADPSSRPQAASAPLTRGERYVVKGGDTLSEIALNHGVPLEVLARSNYLTDIDLLPVGQVLCIPRLGWTRPSAIDAAMEGVPYAVQEGDSLLGIALDHEVSLTDLLFANRLTECSLIRPGDNLVLPAVGELTAVSLPAPLPTAEAIPLEFAYGIQGHALGKGGDGHTLGEEVGRMVLAVVRDLGFTWLKQQVRWEDMEPHRGQRQWLGMDRLLAEADRQGVNVLFSVVAAPLWARESGADRSVAGPPVDNEDFADYLGALASRYCGQLDAIEVWNEQNLHYAWGNLTLSAESYVQLLVTASAAIREACPSVRIISGALVPWVNVVAPAGSVAKLVVDDFVYMQQMLEAGMANYVDGIGAHLPGYNVPPQYTWEEACAAIQVSGNTNFNGACVQPHHAWSFRSTMEFYRDLAARYGASDKPIVPTEFGWASGDGNPYYLFANDNSFQEQADWTVQAYMMMQDWGWVGPAFLWNLNFGVVSPGTAQAMWGIVGADWSPLPVYTALKQMAK